MAPAPGVAPTWPGGRSGRSGAKAARDRGNPRREGSGADTPPGAPVPVPPGATGVTEAAVSGSGPDVGSSTVVPASAISTLPSRDDLVQVWGDGLLAALPNRARARFRVGRFVDVDAAGAVFALPNETHRSYCEEVRREVEAALGARFGTTVPIRLVVDDEAEGEPGTPPPTPSPRGSHQTPVGVEDPGRLVVLARPALPHPPVPKLTTVPTSSIPRCWTPRPSLRARGLLLKSG